MGKVPLNVDDSSHIEPVLWRNFVRVCLDEVFYLCRAPVVVVKTVGMYWSKLNPEPNCHTFGNTNERQLGDVE